MMYRWENGALVAMTAAEEESHASAGKRHRMIGEKRVALTAEEEAARDADEVAGQAAAAAALVGRVRAEADRRLALGFDYDFADARGVHRIGTTDRDLKGWDEVEKIFGVAARMGLTEKTVTISTDTGMAVVTLDEWNAIMLAAEAFRQPIWQASFTLQAMDPVPADYADDEYWI